MWAILRKENRYFFTSAVGIIVMSLFTIINALFLFILDTDYNIFNSGFADLLPFFRLSSWIFIFLIPAITMRSIAEEKRIGMLQILYTKPIHTFSIVLGKYFSILFQIGMILLPSFFFIYIIGFFKHPATDLNYASIVGSYIALFLLSATFASIGLWTSSLTKNQMIAFLLATALCFFYFYGLDQLVQLIFPGTILNYGLQSHFNDISRGVIDSRNLIYFTINSIFFVFLCFTSLKISKI